VRTLTYALCLPATAFALVGALAATSPFYILCFGVACLFTGATGGADLAHWQQRRAERDAESAADRYGRARTAGREVCRSARD
jgi:predicted signal transduction protein with EAL and GGDEF domain